MTHDFDVPLQWCKRCGRPYREIVDYDIPLCDGLPGVTHQRYLKARARAKAIFDPVLRALGADEI